MHQITSYFFMYAKVVVTDKVPFIWTFVIPLVIALTQSFSDIRQATTAEYYPGLSYFWVYITEILRQYFINHPQSIDKYTFLQNSAFTHWVKEKCSKMC